MKSQTSTIPRRTEIYYDTYANLSTTVMKVGDCGYATDRKTLYRWNGATLQEVTFYSGSGLAANIPAAADLPEGSIYSETDTTLTKQVQSAAWVAVTIYSGSGLAANIPAAADLPEGSIYFSTDTAVLSQVQSAAWVAIGQTPTKEPFQPCVDGTDKQHLGYLMSGYVINAEADDAYVEFYVPHDFTTIVEAVIVRFANGAGTRRLNYYSDYGAVGEAQDTHSESLLDQDTVEVNLRIYEQDVSGVLANLAAGDHVGIHVLGDGVNIPNDLILGVRLKYS